MSDIGMLRELSALSYASCTPYVRDVARGMIKANPTLSADEAVVKVQQSQSFADILKTKIGK